MRSLAGHIDLPRLVEGNVGIQTFTVFSTIPRGLNINRNEATPDVVPYIGILQGWPLNTLGSPKQVALYQATRLQKFADQSNGGLIILGTRRDLANLLGSARKERTSLRRFSAPKARSRWRAISPTSMPFRLPASA